MPPEDPPATPPVVDPPATPPATPPGTPAVVPPAAPEAPTLESLVPEAYKDKPWVQELKDINGLFEKADWAVGKVGEKSFGIPQENATPEEKEKFYIELGKPETPAGYEFGEVKPELYNEEFQGKIKELMHKANVSVESAKVLEGGYNELIGELAKGQGATKEQQDAQFVELTTKIYGDKKDEVFKQARALIEANTRPEVKPFLETLSNEALVVMADTLNTIAGKYIKADQLPTGGGAVGPQSADEKRVEGRKLMASEAYKDAFHADHEATVQKVRELYNTA